MSAPIEVIVNAGSGSVFEGETEQSLRERFVAHGVKANVHIVGPDERIDELARKAAEGDAEIIVAGGGDGTVNAVAAEVYRAGKTLGVLPLGTLNNFSKDLEIPQELNKAIGVIAAGHTRMIDLAEVNGRLFINNSSIGLYPRIVRKREQQQRLGRGKWWAAFWAALRVFRIARFLKVRIDIDGKSFLRKTPFVFVGNNEYEMELYNVGRRPRLDEGKLSVYFLHSGGRWGVILLLLKTFTGSVKQWREFEQVLVDSITIHSRRRRLSVAFDGEIDNLETPLEYRILPQALKVIAPVAAE
ncbi:MAG TPA: diacylglycerol kinase family protein [Pyrinomonadaceae bacterium]|nr:diacylglycerol kinase family protein [Pyrinomonadaceae bacterium]